MAYGSTPGNMSGMPNSSSWGLPTNWDVSRNGVPMGILCFGLVIVLVLIAMHLFAPHRRRR